MTTKLEHDLAALFEAQTRGLGVGGPPALDDVELVATEAHRGRRPLLVAVVLLLVAGTAAVGLVARGSQSKAPSATTTPSSSAGQGLLVPVGLERGETPDVNIVEAGHRSPAGLVVSPQGTPYLISIGPKTPAEPGAEQREIGGYLVEFGFDDAFNRYALNTDCIEVGIMEPSKATGGPEGEIGDLLARLVVNDDVVTITAPRGWQSLGAGSPGRLLQLTYDYRFGDGVHTVTLAQAIDTPIAALQSIRLAPLDPARLDGQPAWTFEWPQTNLRSLIWNDNGNAVMLTTDLSLDQLTRHAAVDLQHGQTFDWDGALDLTPEGTLPSPVAPKDTCGESPVLTIE